MFHVSLGVGHVGFDLRGIGVRHHLRAAVLTDVLAVVRDQTVALAGDASLHLARRSEAETLLGARFGLQF